MKQRLFIILALSLCMAFGAWAQKDQTPVPNNSQLAKLGIRGARLTAQHDGVWKVTLSGEKVGHVVSSEPFARDVRGFKGATPVLLYADKKGTIKRIIALPNDETPEFFQEAEGLLEQYKGVKIKDARKKKVNTVSGATRSSRGLIGHVGAAVDAYNKYAK